jgi:hypothetical protein
VNEHLEHIMKHYKESLDELMDAQQYARCAGHAMDPDERTMYATLAKQELEHEDRLAKAADKIAASSTDPTLGIVWKHLRQHLDDWRGSIHAKLGAM